jgi:hypothetical protein
MNLLLYPTYFGPISHYVTMVQADRITFEVQDHFQKQTLRNRMYIYSPNGAQLLNVPVKHSRAGHQKALDIKIDNSENWQKIHFKSLEAAYRSSPFFEYFEDVFSPVFTRKHDSLMDLNMETFSLVTKCLQFAPGFETTVEYFHNQPDFTDIRSWAKAKNDPSQLEPYKQVFDDRHGFINNLSILDLLFNEGRHALAYLERQELTLADKP